MKLPAILGKLPASTSASGELQELDIVKTARMAIVVLVGVFLVAVGQSVAAVCNLDACNLAGLSLKTFALDALQAGVSAVGAAIVEGFRRFLANQA